MMIGSCYIPTVWCQQSKEKTKIQQCKHSATSNISASDNENDYYTASQNNCSTSRDKTLERGMGVREGVGRRAARLCESRQMA